MSKSKARKLADLLSPLGTVKEENIVIPDNTRNVTSIATGSPQTIDSWNMEEFLSAEYLITLSSLEGFNTVKILVMQDGSQVYFTVYGDLGNSTLADFSASFENETVYLKLTTSVADLKVQYLKNTIKNDQFFDTTVAGDLNTLQGVLDLNAGSGSIDLNL